MNLLGKARRRARRVALQCGSEARILLEHGVHVGSNQLAMPAAELVQKLPGLLCDLGARVLCCVLRQPGAQNDEALAASSDIREALSSRGGVPGLVDVFCRAAEPESLHELPRLDDAGTAYRESSSEPRLTRFHES